VLQGQPGQIQQLTEHGAQQAARIQQLTEQREQDAVRIVSFSWAAPDSGTLRMEPRQANAAPQYEFRAAVERLFFQCRSLTAAFDTESLESE
jgi:hypothetical protein